MRNLLNHFATHATAEVRVYSRGPVAAGYSRPMPRWHAWMIYRGPFVAAAAIFAVILLNTSNEPSPARQSQKTVEYIKRECSSYNTGAPSDNDRLCAEYAGRVLAAQRNMTY